VLVGAGAALPVGRGTLVAEWSWDLLVGDASPGALASPQRLGVGARYPIGGGLVLSGGVELALSQRPEPMPDQLVPVEPRVSVLFSVSTDLGGPRRAPGGGSVVVVVVPDETPPPPDKPPPPTTRVLRGRLVDPPGAPIGGAAVRAGEAETTTDENGEFELTVPSGEVTLTVEPPPPWQASTTVIAAGSEPTVLGDVPIERATPPGQVRGVVRDLKGRPVAATVRVADKTVQVGADGQFVVDVAPGEHDVTIEAAGYRTQTRHVVVEQEGVTVLNIDLRPGKATP
jgi:hypothetical protein